MMYPYPVPVAGSAVAVVAAGFPAPGPVVGRHLAVAGQGTYIARGQPEVAVLPDPVDHGRIASHSKVVAVVVVALVVPVVPAAAQAVVVLRYPMSHSI